MKRREGKFHFLIQFSTQDIDCPAMGSSGHTEEVGTLKQRIDEGSNR